MDINEVINALTLMDPCARNMVLNKFSITECEENCKGCRINKKRKLVESKLLEDEPRQRKYFESFANTFIVKKYREKLVDYLFHIHPDDRWSFMQKIKSKKLIDRRPYIEILFEVDKDLQELLQEKFEIDSNIEEDVKYKYLYNYRKEREVNYQKAKKIIFQAFLKKIESQEPKKRSLIYLYFTGMRGLSNRQRGNPAKTRQGLWGKFFAFMDTSDQQKREKIIDVLFHPQFDIYQTMYGDDEMTYPYFSPWQ